MNELKPRRDIRRFDVFAEFNRLKALKEGLPEDEAKGYGLWIAKVVASRRYGVSPPPRASEGANKARGAEPAAPAEEHERFRSLGDEPQTDELFDREIVDRMGERFYREVFAPTVEEHFERGEKYESIRDAVRKNWKP